MPYVFRRPFWRTIRRIFIRSGPLPAADYTLVVEAEDRVVVVGAESRVVIVDAEDRVLVVPA